MAPCRIYGCPRLLQPCFRESAAKEESQCCPEEATCGRCPSHVLGWPAACWNLQESGVSSASRRDPDLNVYDLNISPDLSQSDFSERDVNSRHEQGWQNKCCLTAVLSVQRWNDIAERSSPCHGT